MKFFIVSARLFPAKLGFSFSTLLLSLLNRKAALGRKFSCLSIQQSVAIAGDIVQAIRIKWVLLQSQEIISIYKMEFWCESTIAILISENVDFCFSQKYTLTSSLRSFQFASDPSEFSHVCLFVL